MPPSDPEVCHGYAGAFPSGGRWGPSRPRAVGHILDLLTTTFYGTAQRRPRGTGPDSPSRCARRRCQLSETKRIRSTAASCGSIQRERLREPDDAQDAVDAEPGVPEAGVAHVHGVDASVRGPCSASGDGSTIVPGSIALACREKMQKLTPPLHDGGPEREAPASRDGHVMAPVVRPSRPSPSRRGGAIRSQ
jgi:hypothetical protein